MRRKLIIITMVTTGVALAVAGAAFTVYEQVSLRRDLVRGLAATAEMIGLNSASALSFNDPDAAALTLQSLAAQPQILAACIYNRDGSVFGQYSRVGSHEAVFPPAAGPKRAEFVVDRLELMRPVELDGEEIGQIFIQSDLSELRNRLARSGMIFAVVTFGAGLMAYVLGAWLQRLISQPILQLATVASRVAAESNYALRAIKRGNDEVGALIDGFNNMLDQIQARDEAVRQAHERLEKRVEERTRELQAENIERRRSEDERHRVFTLSLDLICIARFDGFMRRVNPALEETLGFPKGQLETMPYIDMVHPEDRKTTIYKLARLLRGRSVQQFENRVRCADGSYRSILWTGIPFQEEKCFYAYGRDVTELKSAQERAVREESRFKFIFDSLPVGICLEHQPASGGRDQVLNDAHLRICGLTREDAVAGMFQRMTHPDDYARLGVLRQQLEQGSLERFSLEKRYIKADGQIVWVSYSIQRQRFADGGFQDLSSVVDITDVKQAQDEVARERARFKFIFDSVPVGISLLLPGEEGTNLVNPAHVRITGVSAADSFRPGIFASVSHPDDYRRQSAFVKKYSAGEIDHFSVEKRYIHPDGKVVWAVLTSRLIPDPTTARKQSITTLVDITERKAAEATLATTHKELLEASRQAGMAEVATSVLHNVGNVLNSVNISTTLLTDFVRHSKVKNVARLADLLVEHQGNLAAFFTADPRGQKVTSFVQALSTHLTLEQRDLLVELESLRKNVEHIKEIVAMQQHYAKVSGVSEMLVVTELVEDAVRMNATTVNEDLKLVRDFKVQPQVSVDKHKVLQILVNLLRNAKHACDDSARSDKEVIVRITVVAGRVRIAVIDNGVGIPPANLTRIFSHGFTTRKHGHGFGLHSGALAAKELGGSLTAYSDGPGCGATFLLELPEHSQAVAA